MFHHKNVPFASYLYKKCSADEKVINNSLKTTYEEEITALQHHRVLTRKSVGEYKDSQSGLIGLMNYFPRMFIIFYITLY
jgi:hypothetical protein